MPHESATLTIAIPTYGRPEELRRCVQLLRQQSNPHFHLLVLDNASPVEASSALSGLIEAFPALSVRIVRNLANIGGDANILRCFELCQTPFLWVIGDDDEPLPDAVETILHCISETPDALFLNFASDLYNRTTATVSHSLDDFVFAIDSYSNVLFISTSVFRRESLIAEIASGYHYIYSMAAQLVLVLKALSKKPGKCLFLKSRIVRWAVPDQGIAWSGVRQMLGVGMLLDLPLSARARRRLAWLITSPRALETIAVQLITYISRSGDTAGARHAFNQVYGRVLKQSGRRFLFLRFILYRELLFRFPSAGLRAFRWMSSRTGRGEAAFHFRDPFR